MCDRKHAQHHVVAQVDRPFNVDISDLDTSKVARRGHIDA